MPNRPTAASLLVNALETAGVGTLFTLSGNQILSVFDAAIESPMHLIHVRHEAAAVHMADAWGRLTDTPGVALLTAGPGHANGLSALFVAAQAESPLVMLSGHCPRGDLGRGGFQEMEQAAVAGPLTKASWTASDPARVGEDLAKAFRLAAAGRPGPVHISLPSDLLEATINADAAPQLQPEDFQPPALPLSHSDIGAILQLLCEARRPLVLAGPPFLRPAGKAALARLGEAAGAPVIAMESPRGIADPSLGAFGEVLAQADVVLLLGKKLDCTLRFGKADFFAGDCRFVQVDPEPGVLEQTAAVLQDDSRLVAVAAADAIHAAGQLTEAAAGSTRPASSWGDDVQAAVAYRPRQWSEIESTGQPLHPSQLCRGLQSCLGPRSIFISDGGEFGQWAQAMLSADHRLINGPSGSIGSALPFALAAKRAFPDHRVAAVMGDGTFGFHAMELDTAVREKLPVVIVVGNDARWNAETVLQERIYGPDRVTDCELLPTRYDRLAQALGGHGEHVTTLAELEPALRRAFDAGLPACVNVAIQPEPAPVIAR